MQKRNDRIKIAFVTPGDPTDKRVGSGIPYFMAKALQIHCGDVTLLGPIDAKSLLAGKIINKLSLALTRKSYAYKHSVFTSKAYGRILKKKLSEQPFDVIFATRAGAAIAFLDTHIPIVFTSDTTFSLMVNYYKSFSNLLRLSIHEGNLIARRAISKSTVVFYPSEWAANSAINDYGANRRKVAVIPSGANLEPADLPPKELIVQMKKRSPCKLLFLGVDWERKGGQIAFETLVELQRMGVEAELTMCGCLPPENPSHPDVRIIPFLDKNDTRQRNELNKLFLESHFLLLPTRSDTFGIVFCEASAFGVPSIATETGGVSSAIKSGENGFLLPLSAGGRDYARLIAEIYMDREHYLELVSSSRRAFETRLNWDSWALQVKKLIDRVSVGSRDRSAAASDTGF